MLIRESERVDIIIVYFNEKLKHMNADRLSTMTARSPCTTRRTSSAARTSRKTLCSTSAHSKKSFRSYRRSAYQTTRRSTKRTERASRACLQSEGEDEGSVKYIYNAISQIIRRSAYSRRGYFKPARILLFLIFI